MTRLGLIVAFVALSATITHADPSGCWIKGNKSECKQYVGKRLWVAIPPGNPNSVEVTFIRGDWSNTLKLKSGASFVVTGLTKDKFGEYGDYAVRLSDGRTGWVSTDGVFLLDYDPVARRKREAAECERRGQPKIGMNASELIETCWRKPRRIVKRTTASGIEESYIYSTGYIVKLTDGKIAEIIESR